MTREEILAMEPGRKLDRLVAEKVMQWSRQKYFEDGTYIADEWVIDDATSIFVDEWPPSSKISVAWEAEEKIKQLRLHVKYCEALKKVVLSTGEYVGLFDYIHATPAQRCKAALLAVMDKEDKAK